MMMDLEPMMRAFEDKMATAVQDAVRGLTSQARTELGLLVAAAEQARARGEAELEAKRAALEAELAAMQRVEYAQDTRVELDVGGRRFVTSVATLRSKPGTMLDAMFSGRYLVDKAEDGSVFLDRDGSVFGHVLEYLRDGVVSVAEAGAAQGGDIGLLCRLKREFGFFAIELYAEKQERVEMAFAVGGRNSTDPFLLTVECYDAASDTWRAVSAMGEARRELGMCEVAGAVYVSGGYNDDTGSLSSVERYTPSSDTWSAVAAMPEAKADHCACAVGESMYVLGGYDEDDAVLSSVLRYDSSTDSWSEVAPMPEDRYDFGACVVGTDVYVFGGKNDDEERTATVFRYSTVADEWSTLAPMPEARARCQACVLGDMVHVVGGCSAAGSILSSVCRFDPTSGSWSTVEPMSAAQVGFGVFVLGGCMYAAGGAGTGQSAEKYDPDTDSWSDVSRMLGNGRRWFCAQSVTTRAEVAEENLFDNLIAKAEAGRRS